MKRIALAALFVATWSATFACARDLGQYNDVDPQIRACFNALKDKNGIGCCNTADGVRLEDPEWRADDGGGHSVFLDGQWHKVPPSADIVGTTKPCVGYAIVWRLNGIIRCFLPGTGT